MSETPETTQPGELNRRDVLKQAGIFAVSNIIKPQILEASTAPTTTPALDVSEFGISPTVKFLRKAFIEDFYLGESGDLVFSYEEWMKDPTDSFCVECLHEAGLLQKGEIATHATWKRLIHKRIKNENIVEELIKKIEEDERRAAHSRILSGIQSPHQRIIGLIHGMIEQKEHEAVEQL